MKENINKKTIIITSIILIIIIAIFITLNINDNNNQKDNANNITEKENNNDSNIDTSNINITTNSFTLADNKTQLSIKIENLRDTEVSINEILINLYDSSNKIITSQKEQISTTIKAKESTIVNLILDEMYTDTAEIKYEILS